MAIADEQPGSVPPVADLAEHADLPAPDPESPPTAPSTRRQLLALGVGLAASALAPREAAAQRAVRPYTTRPKPPPVPGNVLIRLVRRATNGVTQADLDRAAALGFRAWLEEQLHPDGIEDVDTDYFVSTTYPLLSQPGATLYQASQSTIQQQLQDATLYRAAFSRRQLYERMVHFWTDHFSISFRKVGYLKVADDRDVIRKHALGNFGDLLRASAHSGAMLEYLDNTRSRGTRVNQNYARELMELHTLGVDGGYTQRDVEEVTRCLTGWTIIGRDGGFRFDPGGHDFTGKTVLGRTVPGMPASSGAAGIADGERVLDILLEHPSTARFISTKMIRWLLQYDPPAELVTRVAATFTRTGGDIRAMIRDILTPANLTAAPAKYRQPYQLVVASLRATQPTIRAMGPLTRQLATLGQPLFLWEEPDGYPDDVDWWSGLILQRWNFATALAGLASGDVVVDIAPFMPLPTATSVVNAISLRAFGGAMPEELKQQLAAHLGTGTVTAARARETLALALGSTAFQWY